MVFRHVELNVTECARCGAPIDKRTAMLSRKSGEKICKTCESRELSDGGPVRGEGMSWGALAAGIFSVGSFVVFELHRVGLAYVAGAALGIGAIAGGRRAHALLPSRITQAAVVLGVVGLLAAIFAFIGAHSRPRI